MTPFRNNSAIIEILNKASGSKQKKITTCHGVNFVF